MNTRHSSPATDSDAGAPQTPELGLAAENIALLRHMTRMAVSLAEKVQEVALDRAERELADGVARPDLTSAFARASRTARQCMALAERFDADATEKSRAAAVAAAQRAAKAAEEERRQTRDAVLDAVGLAIASDDTIDREGAEQLLRDLRERLEDEAFDEMLDGGDVAEIAADAVRALGIEPDFEEMEGIVAVREMKATLRAEARERARAAGRVAAEAAAPDAAEDRRDAAPAPDATGHDPP
jgi:hypothetical protein